MQVLVTNHSLTHIYSLIESDKTLKTLKVMSTLHKTNYCDITAIFLRIEA